MKKIIFLFIITFVLSAFAMEQSKEEALFNAIERNDLTTVKKLIDSGVKINIRNENGNTPLIVAIKQKNVAIIKEILNELPDLDVENKEKKIAIEIAQSLPEEPVSARTLKNNIIDLLKLAEIQNDFNYLVFRQRRPDLDTIAKLINAGALVNIPTDERNPLFVAIKEDKLKLVKLLIQHGANVNQRLKGMDYYPFPLFYAVGSSHGFSHSTPEIIKLLLEHGANPNAVNSLNGMTPLIEAVINGGNIDAVQLLLKAGADPLKKDKLQKSALDWAQENLREVTNKLAKATEDEKKKYQREKKNMKTLSSF